MKFDRKIRRQVMELSKEAEEVDGLRVPKSIGFLLRLLEDASDPVDREDIYLALAMEYGRCGLKDEEIATLRKRAAESPSPTMATLGLADRLSSDAIFQSESKQLIEQVLADALRADEFVRMVLGAKARIARRTNDRDMFSDALRALLDDYASKRRFDDVAFEDDFVKDLPADFCSQELVEKYKRIKSEFDE
jgi:hypothetical protein